MLTVSKINGALDAARQCDELTKSIKNLDIPKVLSNYEQDYAEKMDIVERIHNKIVLTEKLNKLSAESSQEAKAASPVGLRFNEGKVRWDLIDPTAVEGVAKVLGFGAQKYTAENWRKGLSWKSTLRSLESHLQALKRGEDIDPESGLPHIDHLGCNWMFFSNYQKMGVGEDDRVKATAETCSAMCGEKVPKDLIKRSEDYALKLAKEHAPAQNYLKMQEKSDNMLKERAREWERQKGSQDDWMNNIQPC